VASRNRSPCSSRISPSSMSLASKRCRLPSRIKLIGSANLSEYPLSFVSRASNQRSITRGSLSWFLNLINVAPTETRLFAKNAIAGTIVIKPAAYCNSSSASRSIIVRTASVRMHKPASGIDPKLVFRRTLYPAVQVTSNSFGTPPATPSGLDDDSGRIYPH
jgi:hypothetical protein